MKSNAVELFRCPSCKSALNLTETTEKAQEIVAGRFTCGSCSRNFEIIKGVPVFLLANATEEVKQVQYSYSEKWAKTPEMYDEGSFATHHQREWHLARYHWRSEEALRQFLSRKQTILDAGCGLGRDVRWYATLQPNARVIGADLSTAAFVAGAKGAGYPNLSVIQADLNQLPFAPASFDFVACDQVLPCVAEPEKAVEFLWSLVKPGGHMVFYVYKKKCPIREFTDDYLRDKITRMTAPQAWDASMNITLLGKALSDLNIEFEVPKDIPELQVKAGRYNLQRFLYYNVLKCFWNDGMSLDENNVVNFDWFHPAYTYRHSVEEIESWVREFGMKVLVLDRDDPSGISVLVQKI